MKAKAWKTKTRHYILYIVVILDVENKPKTQRQNKQKTSNKIQ